METIVFIIFVVVFLVVIPFVQKKADSDEQKNWNKNTKER